MNTPGPVEAGFRAYAEAVLPRDAPPVQIDETRRAYYAGVATLVEIFCGVGSESMTEDEGVRLLDAVQADLDAFVGLVQEGRR